MMDCVIEYSASFPFCVDSGFQPPMVLTRPVFSLWVSGEVPNGQKLQKHDRQFVSACVVEEGSL